MATTANIYTLLKYYASKQNNPMIDYGNFAAYLKKYAQAHLEENQELIAYIGSTDAALKSELDSLAASHLIAIVSPNPLKKYIFVGSYFVEKYTALYKEIDKNISIPFPNTNDLPKNTPSDILVQKPVTEYIYYAMKNKKPAEKTLYGLSFTKNIPMLILPSTVEIDNLFNISIAKIQEMLRKNESHEYFQKKLVVSNPGKEITAKSFFSNFMQKPEYAVENLRESGENFYFWSQLLYFIRQDYDKLTEFTVEDISVLQSVSVIEATTSYLKSQAQVKKQKEMAFNSLMQQLKRPPYYYTYSDIEKLKDSNNLPLLNQYTEDELKQFLQDKSTHSNSNELPELLIIKVSEIERYFILQRKVMPLVVRLCSDARVTVRTNIEKRWNKVLTDYDTLPEMKSQEAFEKCLEKEVKETQPILHAVLSSSFLPLISFYVEDDKKDSDYTTTLTLFRDGILIPYSEILLISRQEIYTDVKIKLPFWYTAPIISWIAALWAHRNRDKKKESESKQARIEREKQKQELQQATDYESPEARSTRKQELRKAAREIERSLVPSNSTLDRELYSYCHEWNYIIGKEAHDNLTEDINSLIRDYLRRVMRTIRSSSFSLERIKSLAETLVAAPAMQKIKNHEALNMYVQLYIIKLVKNLP